MNFDPTDRCGEMSVLRVRLRFADITLSQNETFECKNY